MISLISRIGFRRGPLRSPITSRSELFRGGTFQCHSGTLVAWQQHPMFPRRIIAMRPDRLREQFSGDVVDGAANGGWRVAVLSVPGFLARGRQLSTFAALRPLWRAAQRRVLSQAAQ